MSKASDQDVRDLLALLTTENEWITRQLEHETREHEQTRRALAEAADHEAMVNSLTVELMETRARVERLEHDLADAERRAFESRPATSDALIREQIVRDLIRQAEAAPIPDSEGGRNISGDIADWLRGQMPETGNES